MTLDQLAVLACQKGKKKAACICEPCSARRGLFGENIPLQLQELRRMALSKEQVGSLKEVCEEEREYLKVLYTFICSNGHKTLTEVFLVGPLKGQRFGDAQISMLCPECDELASRKNRRFN